MLNKKATLSGIIFWYSVPMKIQYTSFFINTLPGKHSSKCRIDFGALWRFRNNIIIRLISVKQGIMIDEGQGDNEAANISETRLAFLDWCGI